ncbi:alpha/beta fold hydrolase [Cucumibacter marinus]|uniref:alpha/beta fold hydrolase n=1 Tax=Cucumibacter marinus TaxID=1121252 RepID=UPI00048DE729|nr:alpha/beta hydrolase [Cucumibacter marinus]
MDGTIERTQNGIAYETVGTGDRVVVALPGIGDTRSSYRRLAPLLAKAGCRVYAMDLRGHGDSATGFESYTSEDIGDDVVAFLNEKNLDDVTVVGNSIGAASAVHAAFHSPRVGRIVSLCGFVSDPPKFALIRPMLGLMFAQPWGQAAWSRYRKTLFATSPADMAQNQAEIAQNFREPARLRALRTMMCASKSGIAARLGEVKVPALIAMGEKDPDFKDPQAEAQRQAGLLGGQNSVVMIPAAGHYPQIEQPEATAAAIDNFIGKAIGRGA